MSVVSPYVKQVYNLGDLRNYPIPSGDEDQYVYVDCHTSKYDGGGGFFYYTDYWPPAINDNDGTVIWPNDANQHGAWYRVIDGAINIRYFGCLGDGGDYSDAILRAIDHAASTQYLLKGNTVYFPEGTYGISKPLVLKSGVNLVGDSYSTTFLKALHDKDFDYMITMEKGRIQGCNLANLFFDGNYKLFDELNKTRGCMYFEAVATNNWGTLDGGMWNCTFKNIMVNYFNGNGIVFKGGQDNYTEPNQLIVFENVYVNREKDYTYALWLSGEAGQMTFINSGFCGKLYKEIIKDKEELLTLKGQNVYMQGAGLGIQPDVVSFINCTFQDCEGGFLIENSESITIDGCWFENLDLAITVTANEKGKSKSINILNNRFANAAGFGSLDIYNRNTSLGRCITSVSSQINVYNNYVTVSSLEKDIPNPAFGKQFILAFESEFGKNLGVRTIGNSFQDSRLGYSYGIMQYIDSIDPDPLYPGGNYIDMKDNKLVFVNIKEQPVPNKIDRIQSSISAGETLSIRADQVSIQFTTNMNLFFSNQNGLKLDNGDIATFIKIDNIISKYFNGNTYDFPETYQLISVIKSSSPL